VSATGRLVLEWDTAGSADTPAIRDALAGSAEKALRARRGVAVYAPGVDLTVDGEPCGCCTSTRAWVSDEPGRWVLRARDPGSPVCELLRVAVAAQVAVSTLLGPELPPGVRLAAPVGLSWQVFQTATADACPRHRLLDEQDVADAVLTLKDDEHIELSGAAGPASAAILPIGDGGWELGLLSLRGVIDQRRRIEEPGDLPDAVAQAVRWIAGVR
jgi:hypothetical protein